MPFYIVRNDITTMKVDAIVNAANTELQMGGGVCGAIFKTAGAEELWAACAKLAPIETGQAVITPGFKLPAEHVIHTAGPIYRDGKQGEARLLRSCYRQALALADQQACQSIAFPLISSGIYGYPKDEALRIAREAIEAFLTERQKEQDMDIYLVMFDKDSFRISQSLLGSVESYIDQHYVDERTQTDRRAPLLDVERSAMIQQESLTIPQPIATARVKTLDARLDDLDEPFAQSLMHLIDVKGKTDVEIYKRANIDRRLFSKIRSSTDYQPSKRTVLALAIALELTLVEAEDLLRKAGYALSPNRKFDVIIEYFLVHSQHDIFEINELLFHYDQPLLGG